MNRWLIPRLLFLSFIVCIFSSIWISEYSRQLYYSGSFSLLLSIIFGVVIVSVEREEKKKNG